MKLTVRLIGFLLAAILLIVAIDGFWTVHRDEELFSQKMKENATLLGQTTAKLFSEVWQYQGAKRALALIREINRSEHRIKVRWVSGEKNPGEHYVPLVPLEQLLLVPGDSVGAFNLETDSLKFMAVYIPVNTADSARGFLEMTESFGDLNAHVNETLRRTIMLSVALIGVAGIILLTIGTYFVGRPLRQLVRRTKQIGAGDFSQDRSLTGHDELALLSTSLNRMCEQLEDAQNEIRAQSERRIKAVEQLRHSDRLATVGGLAAGVAHELGTPLNVISGRAKMISTGELTPEESLEYSGIIAQQADRMTSIIRQLLDFARRRTTERKPTDMRLLVKQTIDLLQAMARKSKVEFRFSEPAVAPRVFVDSGQIQQALINVFVNGIQAMPQGGALTTNILLERKRWPTSESPDRPFLAIAVEDEGVGISEENVSQIFDPFFTTKEVGSGTGLGLSITYGIVEDHHGFMTVQSTLNRGTVFTIHLPIEEIQ